MESSAEKKTEIELENSPSVKLQDKLTLEKIRVSNNSDSLNYEEYSDQDVDQADSFFRYLKQHKNLDTFLNSPTELPKSLLDKFSRLTQGAKTYVYTNLDIKHRVENDRLKAQLKEESMQQSSPQNAALMDHVVARQKVKNIDNMEKERRQLRNRIDFMKNRIRYLNETNEGTILKIQKIELQKDRVLESKAEKLKIKEKVRQEMRRIKIEK